MTYVRTHTGERILCCWDDCPLPGLEEVKVRQKHEDGQWWNYIFCTERHKAFHVNAHKEYGRLQSGSGRGR